MDEMTSYSGGDVTPIHPSGSVLSAVIGYDGYISSEVYHIVYAVKPSVNQFQRFQTKTHTRTWPSPFLGRQIEDLKNFVKKKQTTSACASRRETAI